MDQGPTLFGRTSFILFLAARWLHNVGHVAEVDRICPAEPRLTRLDTVVVAVGAAVYRKENSCIRCEGILKSAVEGKVEIIIAVDRQEEV